MFPQNGILSNWNFGGQPQRGWEPVQVQAGNERRIKAWTQMTQLRVEAACEGGLFSAAGLVDTKWVSCWRWGLISRVKWKDAALCPCFPAQSFRSALQHLFSVRQWLMVLTPENQATHCCALNQNDLRRGDGFSCVVELSMEGVAPAVGNWSDRNLLWVLLAQSRRAGSWIWTGHLYGVSCFKPGQS